MKLLIGAAAALVAAALAAAAEASPVASVTSVDELRSLPVNTPVTAATVLGYRMPGDAPTVSYSLQSRSCENAGLGDGGSQIRPAADGAHCWVMNPPIVLDIRNFGASASLADNAPFIQAAINACGAGLPCTISIPPTPGGYRVRGAQTCGNGHYSTTASVCILKDGVRIVGDSASTSSLVFQNGAATDIAFVGPSPTSFMKVGRVENLTLAHGGCSPVPCPKTGGTAIDFENIHEYGTAYVTINNAWQGVLVGPSNTGLMSETTVNIQPSACGEYGVELYGPLGGANAGKVTAFSMQHSVIQGHNCGRLEAVVIDGNVGTVDLFGGDAVLNTYKGLHIRNSALGTRPFEVPRQINANDFQIDEVGTPYGGVPGVGLEIDSGRDIQIENSDIDVGRSNAPGSSAGDAVQIHSDAGGFPTRRLSFIGDHIHGAAGRCMYVDAQDVTVYGTRMDTCSLGGPALWPAVEIGPNASNVTFHGGYVGAQGVKPTKAQSSYGFVIRPGAQFVTIDVPSYNNTLGDYCANATGSAPGYVCNNGEPQPTVCVKANAGGRAAAPGFFPGLGCSR